MQYLSCFTTHFHASPRDTSHEYVSVKLTPELAQRTLACMDAMRQLAQDHPDLPVGTARFQIDLEPYLTPLETPSWAYSFWKNKGGKSIYDFTYIPMPKNDEGTWDVYRVERDKHNYRWWHESYLEVDSDGTGRWVFVDRFNHWRCVSPPIPSDLLLNAASTEAIPSC
jgi:hypothetical protein